MTVYVFVNDRSYGWATTLGGGDRLAYVVIDAPFIVFVFDVRIRPRVG